MNRNERRPGGRAWLYEVPTSTPGAKPRVWPSTLQPGRDHHCTAGGRLGDRHMLGGQRPLSTRPGLAWAWQMIGDRMSGGSGTGCLEDKGSEYKWFTIRQILHQKTYYMRTVASNAYKITATCNSNTISQAKQNEKPHQLTKIIFPQHGARAYDFCE